MNEKHLIERVRSGLDQSAADLDRQTLDGLADARATAVERRRRTRLALAGDGAGTAGLGRGPFLARRWAAAAALLAAATATVYWHGREPAGDPADIDAALLASDLPLKAYTDPRFPAWLQRAEP